MKKGTLNATFGAIFSLSTFAHAAPVQWNLVDMLFDDSGSATGHFIYDNATKKYSDIAIVTTSGDHLSRSTYSTLAGAWGAPSPGSTFSFTSTESASLLGLPWLRLDTNIGFNAKPGDIAAPVIGLAQEGFCVNEYCSSAKSYRTLISGHLVASTPTVPEPQAMHMLFIGLAAITAVTRKRFK